MDEVLQQIQKQRTPAKRVEVTDILRSSAEEQGLTPEQLSSGLADVVEKNPNVRVMRANNTLFIYFNLGDGRVEIAMETVDSPRDLVNSLKDFFSAMKMSGFKSGSFLVENPQIIKAIQMTGANVSTKSTNEVMPDGNTPQMLGIVEF